jgi:hypothetical protein
VLEKVAPFRFVIAFGRATSVGANSSNSWTTVVAVRKTNYTTPVVANKHRVIYCHPHSLFHADTTTTTTTTTTIR